jgi:hypothetical protein
VKKILCALILTFLFMSRSWAAGVWENQGDFYYLTKNSRDNFSAEAAGANKFASKYLTFDGVDFLVRGAQSWKDYGRLDLEGNNLFSLPIRAGMKVAEIHFLAGGNVGNSYKQDGLLRLYGDNYFYAVITVIFAYQDNIYKSLSVPVFWDWFHLGLGEWSRDGARIKSLGNNPARKDCAMFHLSFVNPRLSEPVKDILVTDSWVREYPFSEIFAVTLRSSDKLEAIAKEDLKFKAAADNAVNAVADSRTEWLFENDLDGWFAGCSGNWDSGAFWQAESFKRKGVAIIPACNWAGDKFSWIEKKVALPAWDKIKLEFLRRSAVYSELAKQWSDGLLKVIVKSAAGQETVYEKLYSGEWSAESADLSRYKGKTVIIRLENHGGGQVRLGQASSPACDAEDAVIDEIRLVR